jgi:hypothetical protein
MDTDGNTKCTLPVEGKHYVVKYKSEYDQVDVLEGLLVHIDLNGFVVLNVNALATLIPKDRIYSMRELDCGWPTSPLSSPII